MSSQESNPRQILAQRFKEAGLNTTRFIQCKSGEKASIDHTRRNVDDVEGEYGIYALANDGLCILDVDDYGDIDDRSGLQALAELEPTLEQSSPHGGTHRLYLVEPTEDGRLIADVLEDEFGAQNPKPSWGEVRTANQYVVGAGSQLDGCDKDGCDNCSKPDGGHYELKADRELATHTPSEIVDVLAKDPALDQGDEDKDTEENQPTETTTLADDADRQELLSFARERDDKLDRLLRGDYSDYSDSAAENGVDRSKAECALAYKLAFWLGGDRQAVRRTLDQDLSRRTTHGEPVKWHERDDESYRETVLAAVGKQDEHFDPSQRSDPDPSEIDWDEVERGDTLLSVQTRPTEPAGGLVCENGCYGIPWEYRNDEGEITKSGVDTVCNFTLETQSFLNTENNTDIVLRVVPDHPTEEPYEVRVEPSVFNAADAFRKEIVTGRTTWFDPTNRDGVRTITILRYLRETVGGQPAPHREGTEHIGLAENREEFVTPFGSLTAEGWTSDPGYEFYTKGGDDDETGALPQKWSLRPEDGSEYEDETVARICELLPRIRKVERGLPILGWFYTAPLKPFIHDWEDEFPLLAPHGDTGSGKTSGLRPFMKAFAGDGEPFSASDTSFTIEKHLAESRGFPVWFDEYKPSEMEDHRLRRLHRRLKEVTKERTLAKGTPDLGEVTLHLRAPVILSGEQKVTDAAVRRRAIITNLSQAATRDGTPTKQAFGELTGTAYEDEDGNQHYPDGHDLAEHARAYYQWVLGLGEQELHERWQEARERVKEILREFGVTVEESEQRGLQTVVFGVELHRTFARLHGADPDQLPSEREVKDACSHVVQNIGKGGHRREHADEFLEVLTLAATEGYLEPGVNHRVLESQKFGTEVLAVHMPSAYTAVSKFVRDTNIEGEYTILSKGDYLDSFGNKADDAQSYVCATNERVRGLENGTKAVYFDHEAVAEKLGADFNIDAFRPASEQEPDGNAEEIASPIADLSAGGNPYATITVEVVQWGAGPDGGPAETGVFRDESGTIDVVDFFGCDVSGEFEEGETYLVEDVRVSTYDGTLQLEIVQNTTTASPIQSGVGNTGGDDPDDGQGQLSDAGESESASDGDYASLRGRLKEHFRDTAASGEVVTVGSVAGSLNESPDSVENALDTLARKGEMVSEVEDGYELTY